MNVADLQIGMFVCRLDRPWEDTPFPLQGVELNSREDIDTLRRLCPVVYVDARRLVSYDPHQALTRTELSSSRFKSSTHYANTVPIEQEAPRARAALDTAAKIVDDIFEDIASGRELSVEDVEQAVRPLVASVLRSADAFFLIEGLRRHDSYSYSHAISCSALGAAFGRHLGFDEETIFSLAAGGLLMDVGKTRQPESLLQYQGSLSPDEVNTIRSHVEESLAIIAESDITNQDVLDIVRTHHERHDGSGYPDGLAGNAIPITGRMLGIIDAYDAMSSVRPYRAAISRHQALVPDLCSARQPVPGGDDRTASGLPRGLSDRLAGRTEYRRGGHRDGAEPGPPAAPASRHREYARQAAFDRFPTGRPDEPGRQGCRRHRAQPGGG